jgi:hypothetical protein
MADADARAVTPTLLSVLTCPHCRDARPMAMPTDACLAFHECPACGAMLRPRAGDCCVFCSYGSVACPPVQVAEDCCGPPRAAPAAG